MAAPLLVGLAAAPGVAAGPAVVLDVPAAAGSEPVPEAERPAMVDAALGALEGAALELEAVAARMGGEEGEIIATGALMARDPGLEDAVRGLVSQQGRGATAALLEATSQYADLLAALPDELLAARADDVRSLGRRAARIAGGSAAAGAEGPASGIVVATDLGPADVAELAATMTGAALAGGGPTAHAAIVARSLGIPMVCGLGEAVLTVAAGAPVVVDGDAGTVVLEPGEEELTAARASTEARAAARARAGAERDLPAETTDGVRLPVLVNAATTAEVELGLEAGAEGVGLLRTELAFLTAREWPAVADHRRALEPVLSRLAGRPATVRVLDFGADKLPPFLEDTGERGIALLLRHPEQLAAQLAAIREAGAACDLRIMAPLVEAPGELAAAEALGPPGTRLGAMIETPAAAAAAPGIAAAAAFFSIGTNDLTATTLAVDRFGAAEVAAHDPRVLANVADAVAAAHAAGILVEVCGEAASDPIALPLLLGLGVDEVSVAAARVGLVRAWIRALSAAECAAVAAEALAAPDAAAVAALTAPLRAALPA
jgi:phosphoenolpyruvate-protein kinase (PTS system EI component)